MRHVIRRWLDVAIDAVDAQRLTSEALAGSAITQRTVIAIGKAAPAMCRGAAEALGDLRGVCVAASDSEVPEGVELLIGDHPVPGEASLRAGRRVLEEARSARDGCIALISGGGSSLCEWPRPGVDLSFLQQANRRLLLAGSSIEETNLVRAHLSEIKCGGLARAGSGEFVTYVLSDVADAGPEVVASGPTLDMDHDPVRARAILESIGVTIPAHVSVAMEQPRGAVSAPARVEVIGDGLKAARAICKAALIEGHPAEVHHAWLTGEPGAALDSVFESGSSGLTVAAGETALKVNRGGRGGRNTHAALLAAMRITDTDILFSAFATDGVDGSADAAGAIVDGRTLARGGSPTQAVASFDSADYLARSGDLVVTGPTGTNVADLWLLWRP